MTFEPMPTEEIREYFELIGDEVQAVSVILTDGTMLTGRYAGGGLSGRPVLEAVDDRRAYRVIVPASAIAGILEQVTANPSGTGVPDPSLLVGPAARAGLEVLPVGYFGLLDPGPRWLPGETIQYTADTMIYFDADAISARSGGINGIGGGFLASGNLQWAPKLVSKGERLLKRHVFDVGSQCAAPRADLTLVGYVEFFDVSQAQASAEGGPLLESEGSLWNAATVWSSPPGARRSGDPWALCYFRQDRLGLGPVSWQRIGQPVRVYGDKQPHGQTIHELGVAPCYLKVRVAGCFKADQ
jgi:hypothetical protein